MRGQATLHGTCTLGSYDGYGWNGLQTRFDPGVGRSVIPARVITLTGRPRWMLVLALCGLYPWNSQRERWVLMICTITALRSEEREREYLCDSHWFWLLLNDRYPEHCYGAPPGRANRLHPASVDAAIFFRAGSAF